jgi:osmoprotectant transport system substrate-binding protein
VRSRFIALAAALVLALMLTAAACGDDDADGGEGPGTGVSVTVADKGFAESRIVAEAYAQALSAEGFDASVTSLASTEIADRAIRGGSIDLYPEYVGTSYLNVLTLDADEAPAEREAQFELVRDGYAERGLTALTPAPFNNGNEVACTQEAVDEYGIVTLSDLGEASSNLVYSANAEHLNRPDGLPLLQREYGVDFRDVRTVDISLRYRPIEDGQADCVYAFGTDPLLGSLPLVVLEDDKGTYTGGVSFQTFPVVNTEWLDSLDPEAREAFTTTLDTVNAALTAEVIRPLIARVEIDNEDPDVVAGDFLDEAGITS